MQSGFAALFLSLAMLAAFALAWGGVWLIANTRERKKGVLMIVAALVLVGNVLVWTI